MDYSSYRIKKDGFDTFNYIIMIILAVITIFPFYYVVIISFADYAAVQKHLIYIFPTSINLDAYKLVFKGEMFLSSFFVSIFITVTGTVLSMIFSTASAYALSKSFVPGNKMMFNFILVPMFFSGGLIPYYLTIQKLGLIDKIWVLIIPGAINSFYLILLKNFFKELPASIEESAKIDGANDLYILYRIVLPMSAPVIATISLFYAVDRWNDYYTALLYISNRKLFPLQLVLREAILDFAQIMASPIGAEIARNNRPTYTKALQMAIITVATVPILCVYPFIQKHFTKGILFGAVKE
ncbi:MAG TPA: carbohydrate ABC transporter permease [Clostridiales bacterium]|nr:carbohydrate ABC transporter permease [Clostridiales bacterium]